MRQDRLSMEGMITSADQVLEKAMDKGHPLLFQDLFQKAVGVCLISVVEAGFMVSGNLGSGILLKKLADGSWSPPCAMGLGGVGWGFIVGGAKKDIMIFIFDQTSMEAMCAENGIRVSGQANASLGSLGRNYDAGIGISTKGASGTFSVAFSSGAFIGGSLEFALTGVRGGVNDTFYGQTTTPEGILKGEIALPEGAKKESLQGVYDKLTQLAAVDNSNNNPSGYASTATSEAPTDAAVSGSQGTAQQTQE